MTHRVWQSIQRKKRKNKLVRKKNFTEPVKVEKPKKIKLRRKIAEDVHPKVLGALKAKPPQVLDKVLAARNSEPESSGLAPNHPAKGSSRAVIPVKNDHVAMVDGKSATMKGIVKMAYNKEKNIEVGQAQNRVEASAKVQKYATLVRDGKGGYKTNKNGVVPPVFKHGNNHTFIHAGHAEDVSDYDIREITKTKHFPHGLNLDQISLASHPNQDYYDKSDPINKHPLVKAMTKFRKETGIGDLHSGNIGAWTHPHTGKKHLVIRDAGFDPSVAKHYGWAPSGGVKAKSNPTQVTKSLDIKTEPGHQYSMDVHTKQGRHQDMNAERPKNTREKYSLAMHNAREARAEAKYKNIRPNTKEMGKIRGDFLVGKVDRHEYDAAQHAHYIGKVKKIVRKKNTADINTDDAYKVRFKYMDNKAGWDTNNKAAMLAGENRQKRDK